MIDLDGRLKVYESRVALWARWLNSQLPLIRIVRRYLDLVIILGGALGLLLLMSVADPPWFVAPLRLLLGSVYVLFVPGYCMVAAFFPAPGNLDGMERFGLSIGLSLAIVSGLALLLDSLPWGIQLWSVAAAEYCVVALFWVIALWLRSRLPQEARNGTKLACEPRRWWKPFKPDERRIGQILLAVCLLALIAGVWVLAIPSPDRFMTDFYVLGKEGLAENYPRAVTLGNEVNVTLGIVNRERVERTYRVEAWVIDERDSARRSLVAQVGPVWLTPGDRQQSPVTWLMPWLGTDQKVELLLFADNEAQPYRQLRLWVDVVEPPGT